MKIKLIALAIITLLAQSICAQNIFKAIVKDGDTKEILVGVNAVLNKTANGASSDENGIITISNIPDGKQHITFSYLGYESETKSYTFPLSSSAPVEIFLEQDDEMLEEVTISSTRGTRTIQNIPTRVEFISSEELGEKGSMKPGDIRMLLNESTGIITQQTSATSGNASIRIQGLDGRYTQILKDGFPVFAGAASGLGLLQTPPLDLKQVEIIKGSTSTLYGGGAIAGLINLISKTPEEKRDLGLHLKRDHPEKVWTSALSMGNDSKRSVQPFLLPTTEIGLTTPLTPDSQPFRSLTDMSSTPNYFSIFQRTRK